MLALLSKHAGERCFRGTTYTAWWGSSTRSYAVFNESSLGEYPLHCPKIVQPAAMRVKKFSAHLDWKSLLFIWNWWSILPFCTARFPTAPLPSALQFHLIFFQDLHKWCWYGVPVSDGDVSTHLNRLERMEYRVSGAQSARDRHWGDGKGVLTQRTITSDMQEQRLPGFLMRKNGICSRCVQNRMCILLCMRHHL